MTDIANRDGGRRAEGGPARRRQIVMTLVRVLLYSAFVLCLMLVVGPIAVIIGISFSPVDGFIFPPQGLSWRWYQSFLQSEKLWGSLIFSFRTALVVAALSLLLGTLAALALARRRDVTAVGLQSLFMAPMVFPAIILGLAILLFVRVLGAPLWIGLIIAHVLIGTPYCFRMVTGSLQAFDPTLEEASQSLGAGPLRTFAYVIMPLIWPGMLAGAMFAFIVSFGENNAALFLSSPGYSTMPIELLGFLQFPGNQLVVAAASTIQVGLIVVFITAMERLVGFARMVQGNRRG
ncbi:MAG: ABC transporter permease [Alphaproteobacteria bacterium]|nr:ABC transporter permease [Alphaproteobacteria bacterium]